MKLLRSRALHASTIFPFFLLFPLLFVFSSGCKRKSPPEKVSENPTAAVKLERTKPGEINLKDTKLAAIPEAYSAWSNITFSVDGRQVFYVAEKKNKKLVVVGNEPGKEYEDTSFMIQSRDGRRFAFGGVQKGKKRLIVDNKELIGLYHEEVAPSSFSPDSRFVACEVGSLNERKWFVLVSDGGKEVYRSQVYPDTWRRPVFSPDGRLLVYELGDDKMKIDNKKSTLFFLDVSSMKIIKERLYTDYRTGKLSFSYDSSRVVYDIPKKAKNFLSCRTLA